MTDRGLVMISRRKLLADSLVAALKAGGHCSVRAMTPEAALERDALPPETALVLIDAPDCREEVGALVSGIRRRHPGCRVAVVADGADARTLTIAEAAGADAYLTTTVSVEAFSNACRLVSMGVQIFPPAPTGPGNGAVNGRVNCSANGSARPEAARAEAIRTNDGTEPLSDRENEVLAALTEGLSNKEIARRFDITESTVKTHLKGILRKIGVSNRTQAAIWAHERGYGSAA